MKGFIAIIFRVQQSRTLARMDTYCTAKGTMTFPNISTCLLVTVAQKVTRHIIITFCDI